MAPEPLTDAQLMALKNAYDKVKGPDGEVTADELIDILNVAFVKGGFPTIPSPLHLPSPHPYLMTLEARSVVPTRDSSIQLPPFLPSASSPLSNQPAIKLIISLSSYYHTNARPIYLLTNPVLLCFLRFFSLYVSLAFSWPIHLCSATFSLFRFHAFAAWI